MAYEFTDLARHLANVAQYADDGVLNGTPMQHPARLIITAKNQDAWQVINRVVAAALDATPILREGLVAFVAQYDAAELIIDVDLPRDATQTVEMSQREQLMSLLPTPKEGA